MYKSISAFVDFCLWNWEPSEDKDKDKDKGNAFPRDKKFEFELQ